MAETRKVTAHREMAVDAIGAQQADQRGVAVDVELEDQREADQERPFARDANDLGGDPFDIGDQDVITERRSTAAR